MANDDAVFRSALVWLAVFLVMVGLYTHSFKKMFVTYVFGVLAIAGVLLPDWDFFDRDFSKWCSPVAMADSTSSSLWTRFRMNPLRLVVYSTVYGYGLYKWWMFISN